MRSRIITVMLFAALAAPPLRAKNSGHASSGATHASTARVAGKSSVGTVSGTSAGYHSSAGYGSAYGWGYKGWTKNGYKDGQWHGIPYSSPTSQPSGKRGSSSTSYASGSEMEIIQQQIARRHAQEAQQHSQPSSSATPTGSSKQQ